MFEADQPTKKSFLNLRHAQARNIIEHIFGVLKKRWDILNCASQYDMDIQACIPAGLAATHNFILGHDDTDIHNYLHDLDPSSPPTEAVTGDPGHGAIPQVEQDRAEALHEEIATRMWESYQQFL
ncbi:hypothetical protein BYT27DRAFT_7102947 [Phlegmacium glaucopus]|nr:hypothetical protein BYT27DRAFT_7102947 [Phlegmacium glaucopus]